MGTEPKERRSSTDFSKLEPTIEELHGVYGADTTSHASVEKTLIRQAITYLEWLDEMLANRKSYHKKQQVKRKLLEREVRKLLSASELAEIDRLADKAIGNLYHTDELEGE